VLQKGDESNARMEVLRKGSLCLKAGMRFQNENVNDFRSAKAYTQKQQRREGFISASPLTMLAQSRLAAAASAAGLLRSTNASKVFSKTRYPSTQDPPWEDGESSKLVLSIKSGVLSSVRLRLKKAVTFTAEESRHNVSNFSLATAVQNVVSTAQASGVKDKGAPSAIENLFLGED